MSDGDPRKDDSMNPPHQINLEAENLLSGVDPDGDEDDDSTPQGDTDHDFWNEDGTPTEKCLAFINHHMNGGCSESADADASKLTDEQGDNDAMGRSDPEPESEAREVEPLEDLGIYDPNEVRADKPRFAMPDGSYPIDNCHDVHSAAVLAHHSGSYSFEAIKRHVLNAKKELGCPDTAIPKSWDEIAPRNFEAEKNACKVSGTIERRNLVVQNVELRANESDVKGEEPKSYTLIGYAAVFNSLSENLGGFRERIQPGAFRGAITKGDTVALWNHDERYPLANIDSGTLRLFEDRHGLRSEIDLDPNVSYARDLLFNVRSGRVSKMSFGFTTDSDEWAEEDGQTVRTLTGIRRLLDVSPVTNPAYRDTEVAARALLKADEIRNRQAPLDDPSTAAGMNLLLLQANLIERGLEF